MSFIRRQISPQPKTQSKNNSKTVTVRPDNGAYVTENVIYDMKTLKHPHLFHWNPESFPRVRVWTSGCSCFQDSLHFFCWFLAQSEAAEQRAEM